MEFCGVSRFYWAAESYLVVEVLVFTKTLSVAGSCSEDRKKKEFLILLIVNRGYRTTESSRLEKMSKIIKSNF